MGKKIRLRNCDDCGGFVLVDVAGDDEQPLLGACRHCGASMEPGDIAEGPVDPDDVGGRSAIECDNCGAWWPELAFGEVIDDHGGCPSCKPDEYEPRAADD